MKRATVISLSFVIFLLVFAGTNFQLIRVSMDHWMKRKVSFIEFTQEMKEQLSSDDFAQKNFLLDINGLYARISGRRLYNDTIRLNNGMLARPYVHEEGVITRAEMLAEYGNGVREMGIPFIFMMAPYKMPMDGSLLPAGLEDRAHKDADAVIAVLEAAEIDTIDTRPLFCQTAEQLEQWFYRTDHHWKPISALESVSLLLEHLRVYDSEITPEISQAKVKNWSIRDVPNIFLGSQGRRVGKYYGGVDAMQVIIPNFDTDLSLSAVWQNHIIRGDYSKAELSEKLMDPNQDMHLTDRNCIYTGGDYGLVLHRNSRAPLNRRILLIKDSFSLPLQTFLATIFSEVDVIDPRRDNGFTIAEYTALTRPDAVIVELNPTLFLRKDYFEYGEFPNLPEKQIILDVADSYVIEPSENAYNCAIARKGFSNGTAYRLHVDEITLSNWEAYGVSVLLYGGSELSPRTILDAGYCSEHGCDWSFLTPSEGSENMELCLCAGVFGCTGGLGASFSGVRLEEYTE